MAWLEGPAGVLAWQIDHDGSWRAEPADRHDNRHVLLAGPTGREHQWSLSPAPGETFASITTTVGRHGRPRHRTGGAAPHRTHGPAPA
ncbi:MULTISPECIES: hypothetical protein [unclassified Streptomyces]|uniref:hypothetical protein n=1 Tax=unclassified Streptomyces TaxID=2593676 RepID=UPI00336AA3A2